MECAPWQLPPHTITFVERWTDKNKFGEGVNRFGLIGSNVIVARIVGVNVGVGKGVFVAIGTMGLPGAGVVVGGSVFNTNKFGVFVGSREYGVTVGWGEAGGADVCRNGIEMGTPEHPETTLIRTTRKTCFFIIPLR